jgi:hypothetical protein
MSDIFIKYVVVDGKKAEKLAAVFEQEHWSVWADPHTVPQTDGYGNLVAEELKSAKVIVVLWSQAAARDSAFQSELLKHKARVASISVLLENFKLPLALSLLRGFNLSDWDGEASHAGLTTLLHYVRALIATAQPPAVPPNISREFPRLEVSDEVRPKKSGNSRPERGSRFKGVFISYRRSEAAAYARGLYDRLAAHFGSERVFLDLKNVRLGENFVKAITSAAESCAVMIALISPRWLKGRGGQTGLDDYVRLEVATALRRGIQVIPVYIPSASRLKQKDLPEDLSQLASINSLTLSDARWDRDVEDLINSFEGLLSN